MANNNNCTSQMCVIIEKSPENANLDLLEKEEEEEEAYSYTKTFAAIVSSCG